ncbi:MAG: hypothetical protein RLZZ623_2680 [Actinomycetota bacterium]
MTAIPPHPAPLHIAPLHIAQLNVARLRAPIEHSSITEFREALAPVNAIADAASGFVWRLQTEAGDATAVQMFDDPLTIVNLTLWQSIEALRAFAYAGMHRDFLRRKAEWFSDLGRRSALWYVPGGQVPSVAEARERLEFLDAFGDSPYVFSTARDRTALVVAEHPLGDHVAQQLITELNADLRISSPEPGSNFFTLLPEQVAPGAGAFVVAQLGGEPIGCGAVRLIEPHTAEIKRMYVRAGGRGSRIGTAIMHDLQRRAMHLGARRLVLETGPRQHAALALYARCGFTACAPWGEYLNSPTSLCFEKALGRLPS